MSVKISAELVNELRRRTGVGMNKCKEALEAASGDMEKAIDFLRKSGMAGAVKKEGRETKEGLIGHAESKNAVALVEVNAETDFVAQNEKFRQFLKELCQDAAEKHPKSLEEFLKMKATSDPRITIDELRALVIQSLGENIQVKRMQLFMKDPSLSIGVYSHMGGKIVVVVELSGGSGHEILARDIAMHTAAEAPEYLRPEDVPHAVKMREEEIARGQVAGKPPQIIDKIVEGKLKAFYDQVCLVCQKFVKDNAITIRDLLEKESKRLGKTINIQRYVRWKIGE